LTISGSIMQPNHSLLYCCWYCCCLSSLVEGSKPDRPKFEHDNILWLTWIKNPMSWIYEQNGCKRGKKLCLAKASHPCPKSWRCSQHHPSCPHCYDFFPLTVGVDGCECCQPLNFLHSSHCSHLVFCVNLTQETGCDKNAQHNDHSNAIAHDLSTMHSKKQGVSGDHFVIKLELLSTL